MKSILISIILLVSCLSGQDEIPLLNLQNQKYNTSLEKLYQNRSVISHSVAQVLESELDADQYIIGPGDHFKVSIFGELEESFDFKVLPEGKVLIPTVGEIDLNDILLRDAKRRIKDAVSTNYINATVSVNLTGLRKFRVYYTGEVKAPGTYFAQGSDRLSDIIEISLVQATMPNEVTSSLSDWADDTRIQITHADKSIDMYDLSQFYRLGDKSQNPYLQGGDIIYVPSIDLNKAYVIIEGNVGFQGVHTLKKNETLFNFLTRVSALSKKSNLQSIIVERNSQNEVIDILNDQESYRGYTLQNKDKIIIPTIHDRVYVRGEVFNPGSQPYLAHYTAKDYVGRAGALDSAVDIEDVLIMRQSTSVVLQGADVIIEKGDTIVLPKRARELFKDYMQILTPIISIGLSAYAIIQASKK
ncbi:MAG: hypothetical protein D8M58_00175 [Calditrichaeota bacterium]|nr:MAG: hypothetical protein DWQ03_06905 [Calditrichota bacterium]MBL1203785.1 hypothetical protein [Calditrichota bacterium]NOG43615.1 hypothetical protein [Calditrichota bacterium]